MNIRLDRPDRAIAVITLDNPERRNAMTEAMGKALEDAAAGLVGDDDLRVVVLTGAPPAFSAGGDLEMLERLARETRDEGRDASAFMRTFYDRFLSLGRLPVPVIAAVNGHAIGAGLCVALSCDLRIVASEAKLGLNFSRLGLHPGMGGSWLLPRIIGPQRAAEWLYTGKIVDGVEAASVGLALAAVPSIDVLSKSLDLAEQVAASAPLVVRQIKAGLQWDFRNLGTALDFEARSQAQNYASADLPEGLLAMRESRPPVFEGR